MNAQELRDVLGNFRVGQEITAYPAALDDGVIIISTDLPPQQILKVGIWMGEITIFYEESPAFIAILMSDESLCQTVVCDTREGAVNAAIKFVKEYSTLVDLQDTAREYLLVEGVFSFAEGGFGYTVHVGKAK